jgi:thymidine kinase
MERIQNGYLEVILGPMFSGKTSKLVEIYKQYTFCNIPVMVINHQEDNRYSTDSVMVTHDAVKIKCVQCNTLSSILESKMELFSQAPPVILINEGQFFPDLYNAVHTMVYKHKMHVYVAGLDGDFRQKKFGQMLDLIPICDKVYKLHSLCVWCKNGTKAIFSHRTDTSCQDQKLVGASESYIPLCRSCHSS